MAASGPFERWWAAIRARMGEVVDGELVAVQDGETIRFFSDNETGKYMDGGPLAMAYELVDDNYVLKGIGAQRGPGAPGPLWICWTRVKLHIWGNTADQTHEMRRRLIAAVHDIAGADNYRLESGTWHSREVDSAGVAYSFLVGWALVITRDPNETATVTIADFRPLGLEMKNPGDTLP